LLAINTKYQLSFSSGSLLIPESIQIASVFRQLNNWTQTRQKVLKENLLKKDKLKTTITLFREIQNRLSMLTNDQIDYLIETYFDEQVKLLFLGVCKCYPFMAEFVIEVLRSKILTFNDSLSSIDYDRFFEMKEEIHPELESLTDSSKKKNRQVVFKILAEAGIIESVKIKRITPSFLSKEIKKIVVKDNPAWLKVFLLSDIDIQKAKEKYASE